MKDAFRVVVLFSVLLGTSFAQDPGWPRQIVRPGGTMIIYQPQVDEWTGYTDLKWRQAFKLTPTGGQEIVGAASFDGTTQVNTENHTVFIYNLHVLNTYFPSQDPATWPQLSQLVKTFIPPSVDIALERVVAYTPKPDSVPTVPLNNDPPFIFVSQTPAILLGVDGDPVQSDILNTDLKYVVNTNWPLFYDKSKSQYYLLVDNVWLSAADLHGPWAYALKLSSAFNKLPNSGRFASIKSMIPPPAVTNPVIPTVFYSTGPSEVILFDGPPQYVPIQGTQLSYANNTDSPVFLYGPTQTVYYLAAGRWFSAGSLAGPWTFASANLPQDFSNIPLSAPPSAILSSVPGTPESKDAVLIAQIPTTMTLNAATAAAQAKVTYAGPPVFAPITGTTLQYATNTPDKVIQVGDAYYLCLQGAWFMAPTAQGPWTTAATVPQVIYTIPPSSPVYNVTYVTQVVTTPGYVQTSYTAGYMGAFVLGVGVGAIVASGTGFYYPPYVGYPVGGYPVYHPYATPYGAYGSTGAYYNNKTGAYGVSQTAYGAYGSATRTASYNPYTGTATRTASTSTAYGKQSVGQAYNPYTGSYGATHQGSSPTAQWGQSYVSQGNKSATTQHYSNAYGTTASAQGSQGGKAYGTTAGPGSTAVAKNSSGDVYAGHDGNVYQKSSSGWQQYNNGSWNDVNKSTEEQEHPNAQTNAQNDKSTYDQQHPTSQSAINSDKSSFNQSHPNSQATAQSDKSNYNSSHPSGGSSYHPSGGSSQGLDSEARSRDSGSIQSSRFQSGGADHSFGGFGGGGRSWGGGGGGFRR